MLINKYIFFLYFYISSCHVVSISRCCQEFQTIFIFPKSLYKRLLGTFSTTDAVALSTQKEIFPGTLNNAQLLYF